jgi:two-component system chemotaxis sensor kinase CheA
MLGDIINSLPSIAKELDKEQPRLEIHADNVRFQNCACDLMTNVFSHLLRNSVDHGLETTEERAAAGKNTQGTIELTTEVKGDHLEIRLKDDGKGLNLTRLHKKGIENGIWTEADQPRAEEIAALMFRSGVSTKEQVSSISGRGVGMDAVKQFLLDKGGNIELHLLAEKTEDSDYVPFETILTLPQDVFIRV